MSRVDIKTLDCISSGVEAKEVNQEVSSCGPIIALEEDVTPNGRYTHRLLREQPERRDRFIETIRIIVQKAHEDAKRRLRTLADISLDPLGASGPDPALGYPERLPLTTLKGYFGEVLAGTIAENFEHFGVEGWHVPAYSFRYHHTAFDFLELLRQGEDVPKAVVGRTGDDVLAFKRHTDGRIAGALVCEAKCSSDHDSSAIRDAHEKVSKSNLVPVEILRLIEILQDYDDTESAEWVRALRLLYQSSESELDNYERHDLVSYACGRKPVNKTTWMTRNVPHHSYSGQRRLEAVEFHLIDVDDLVQATYQLKEASYVRA